MELKVHSVLCRWFFVGFFFCSLEHRTTNCMPKKCFHLTLSSRPEGLYGLSESYYTWRNAHILPEGHLRENSRNSCLAEGSGGFFADCWRRLARITRLKHNPEQEDRRDVPMFGISLLHSWWLQQHQRWVLPGGRWDCCPTATSVCHHPAPFPLVFPSRMTVTSRGTSGNVSLAHAPKAPLIVLFVSRWVVYLLFAAPAPRPRSQAVSSWSRGPVPSLP